MYRKTTRENQNRPLYKCCDYCGRNDHKVAVKLTAEVRLAGKTRQGYLPHPVVGYCTSCYERHVERAAADGREFPVGPVVYDLRGAASLKRHPSKKAVAPEVVPAPPARVEEQELHAVFAVDADRNTFRVSDPMGWGAAQDEWLRLDDLRRAGRLPQARFFEVRSVTLGPDRPLVGPEVRSHDRYDRAPLNLNLTTPTLEGSRGHADVEDAAHKAWKLFTGGVYTKRRRNRYTGDVETWTGAQGEGGWFYYPNGTTAAQGKADLVRVAKQRRLVVQGVDGRWYVVASVLPEAA